MKIALLAPDSSFPNFALMKVSAYHKAHGDDVLWESGLFTADSDLLYISKVFTYTKDPFVTLDHGEILRGGTGYDVTTNLPDEIEKIEPDYSLYPGLRHALGFLTRGCIRKCKHCFVPEKEGMIAPYRDIEQILQGRETAVLMDNNVLACEYGIRQIEKIGKLGVKVDFNQGLDARLIDDAVAKVLAKVKWLVPLRLACDNKAAIKHVRKAVEHLRWHNCVPTRYFVYVLVRDVSGAVERVRFLKSMNLDPFAQPYRDRRGTVPTRQQADFARWVNRKHIFRGTSWEEYSRTVSFKHEMNDEISDSLFPD